MKEQMPNTVNEGMQGNVQTYILVVLMMFCFAWPVEFAFSFSKDSQKGSAAQILSQIHLLVGDQFMEAGLWEEALQEWEKALELDPMNEEAHWRFIRDYLSRPVLHEKFVSVLRHFFALQAMNPGFEDDPSWLKAKADFFWRFKGRGGTGDSWEMATSLYERVLKEYPHDSEILRRLSVLIGDHGEDQSSHYDQALDYARQAVKYNPEGWRERGRLGMMLLKTADHLPALREFSHAIDLVPESEEDFMENRYILALSGIRILYRLKIEAGIHKFAKERENPNTLAKNHPLEIVFKIELKEFLYLLEKFIQIGYESDNKWTSGWAMHSQDKAGTVIYPGLWLVDEYVKMGKFQEAEKAFLKHIIFEKFENEPPPFLQDPGARKTEFSGAFRMGIVEFENWIFLLEKGSHDPELLAIVKDEYQMRKLEERKKKKR